MTIDWQRTKLRFIYFLIGLAIGLGGAVFVGYSYNQIVQSTEKHYESRIVEYRETIAATTKHVSILQEENMNLKKQVKIVEQTNADGSSSKTYEAISDLSKETRSLEQITEVQSLKHIIELERMEHSKEVELIKKTKPSLQFLLGIDSTLTPYVSASYNVYGPYIIGGYGNRKGEFGVGIGIGF